MTKADQYCQAIRYAADSGDHDTSALLVSQFYERVREADYTLSVERAGENYAEVLFTDVVTGDVLRVEYRYDRNVFLCGWVGRYATSRWSDADLANELGLPVAWIDGLFYGLQQTRQIFSLQERVKKDAERARKSRVKAAVKARSISESEVFQQKLQEQTSGLRYQADEALRELRSLKDAIAAAGGVSGGTAYPPMPLGFIKPTRDGIGLPSCSGIYSVWHFGVPVYVGQSVNISQRARLSHERIGVADMLSYVAIETSELNFAECYYIAVLRPERNFGKKRMQ